MKRKMNKFLFWRLTNGQRQVDVESEIKIKKWKLSLFELGHAVLTKDELKRLANLTGIACDELAQPCD